MKITNSFAIGVDVGGSHITTAVIDLENRVLLKDTICKQDVDSNGEASKIFDLWAKTISESMKKSPSPIKGIGMAMPGPFNYSDGISLIKGVQKFERIYGLNVRQALQRSLGINLPIQFINDASAFAAGEAFAGSGKGYKKIMAITLGTGFGSAFIENEIPIVKRDDVPKMGCLFHLPFKNKIADEFFSTRWFIGRYKDLTGKEISGVKDLVEIAKNDNVAKRVFDEFGLNLGRFLSKWLKGFNTDMLILGGNISKAYLLFENSFTNELNKEKVNIKISVSKLKENAALLGSAHLIDEKYWNEIKTAISLM